MRIHSMKVSRPFVAIKIVILCGLSLGCTGNKTNNRGENQETSSGVKANLAQSQSLDLDVGSNAPRLSGAAARPIRIFEDALRAEIDLSLEPSADGGSALELVGRLTLINQGNESITIRANSTPLSGHVSDEFFRLFHNGTEIHYRDIIAMPTPGAPTQKITIPAGGTHLVSRPFFFAKHYEIGKPGFYRVSYDQSVAVLKPKGRGSKAGAGSPGIYGVVTISGSGSIQSDQPIRSYKKNHRGFSLDEGAGLGLAQVGREGGTSERCTDQQFGELYAAVDVAGAKANEAVNHIEQVTQRDGQDVVRYKSWFGPYDKTTAARAMGNYMGIRKSFTDMKNRIGFLCHDCQGWGQGSGYVYKGKPYQFYICPGWWNHFKPDGQAPDFHHWGALIHEASHWHINGGTHDHIYGHNQTRSWAASNAASTHNNADSYRFFAENSKNEGLAQGQGGGSGGGGGGGGGCNDQYRDLVHKSYIGYYGRCADGGGMNFWCSALASSGGQLDGIIAQFGTSQEFTQNFGSLQDEQLISNLYQHFFDRAAEPEGVDFYKGVLRSHASNFTNERGTSNGAREYALSKIALDILFGASGGDVDKLAAKVSDCVGKLQQ